MTDFGRFVIELTGPGELLAFKVWVSDGRQELELGLTGGELLQLSACLNGALIRWVRESSADMLEHLGMPAELVAHTRIKPPEEPPNGIILDPAIRAAADAWDVS